ncbi:hypothetical protein HK102_002168 [Quaeritorhiza haematococci]|nr:hypothetical protein HK102_002168 [Quaeritorhiza haematococci]
MRFASFLTNLRGQYRSQATSLFLITSIASGIPMNLSSYFYYIGNRNAQHVVLGRKVIGIIGETTEGMDALQSSIRTAPTAATNSLAEPTQILNTATGTTLSQAGTLASTNGTTMGPSSASNENEEKKGGKWMSIPLPKFQRHRTATSSASTSSSTQELTVVARQLYSTLLFITFAAFNIGVYNVGVSVWAFSTLQTQFGIAGISYATCGTILLAFPSQWATYYFYGFKPEMRRST